MLKAMEELMRLHPASRIGRWEHPPSEFEVFEELERRHLLHQREYEANVREPTWMIGDLAAAVAILVAFVSALSLIAHSGGDASEAGQRPVVAASGVAEPR